VFQMDLPASLSGWKRVFLPEYVGSGFSYIIGTYWVNHMVSNSRGLIVIGWCLLCR